MLAHRCKPATNPLAYRIRKIKWKRENAPFGALATAKRRDPGYRKCAQSPVPENRILQFSHIDKGLTIRRCSPETGGLQSGYVWGDVILQVKYSVKPYPFITLRTKVTGRKLKTDQFLPAMIQRRSVAMVLYRRAGSPAAPGLLERSSEQQRPAHFNNGKRPKVH
ncbi:hypothetical protein TNCT_243341 [Trichonephila clavata]|uniref:Uncharacterized protein n=1 Tax=Trichonephila clavata TaxID=2740835 RepID=A0A8X6J9V6_TRICU|nr:hypothetical protein TNCT_243341 [Trichonephila clavata]